MPDVKYVPDLNYNQQLSNIAYISIINESKIHYILEDNMFIYRSIKLLMCENVRVYVLFT